MASQQRKAPTIRHGVYGAQGLPGLKSHLVRYQQFLVTSRCLVLLCYAATLFLAGCADTYPRLEVLAPLPETPRCRMLVLPFIYQGDFPRGENIVSKAFAAEMAAVPGFEVVAEGDVQQLYRQFRLYPRDLPNEDQLRIMANQLGAETVVTGEILHMSEVDAGEVDTELTLVVKLHAGETGRLLWSTYHKRQGEEYRNVLHYGRVNSMSGLARRMAQEMITLWLEKGMTQCTR